MQKKVQVWIFTKVDAHWKCLLLRTNSQRGSFWQPITGSVESFDASLLAAAKRELKEETGIEIELQETGRFFEFVNSFGSNVQESVFFGIVEQPRNILLDAKEHSEYQWIEAKKALEMVKFKSNQEQLASLLHLLQDKP